MTTYKVIQRGEVIQTTRSETEAIKLAESLGTDAASVVMHEVSGTHQSDTQIWPTVGPTYTN